MNAIEIARVCHEANRALQIITGDPVPSPPWHEAPKWQRDSALDGVAKAIAGATPEQLHQAWCDLKLNVGWVYGPIKDDTALTHPCLVAYAELPPQERVKDALFGAIVKALSSGAE